MAVVVNLGSWLEATLFDLKLQVFMAIDNTDGPRVEGHREYYLRSGRRVEYDSPLVSRVPRNPACNANDDKK